LHRKVHFLRSIICRPLHILEFWVSIARCKSSSEQCLLKCGRREEGFNFSKCSQCKHYKDLIDMSIKGNKLKIGRILRRSWEITTTTKVHAIINTMHGVTHYAIELWPTYSNFAILSLARCLYAFKKPPMQNCRNLFDELQLNDYFKRLFWANPSEF
jgi:hypothetical protein